MDLKQLKKLLVIGLLVSSTNIYAGEQPTKCPSILSIITVGLDHATFVGDWVMYAGYQTSYFDTNVNWHFHIGDVEAKHETALSKLTEALKYIHFEEGPVPYTAWGAKGKWICRYKVNDFVSAHAITIS